MTATRIRRATVIGTGLIGGSIGLGLRDNGWIVSGMDHDSRVLEDAIDVGAIDQVTIDPDSDLVVVATPVGSIAEVVNEALLACPHAVVTDVGGVKLQITSAVADPRFVGGHPMAGSEQLGIEGATGALFTDAAWVLTPTATTSDHAFSVVRDMATSLGAQVLTLDAARHDALVAIISHVPHLTAASLVEVASRHADDHPALLRLAAGGFRDMTRIAAGSPTIWPDVCAQNRTAIIDTIDELIETLQGLRTQIATTDRSKILQTLAHAQGVRRSLPARADDTIEAATVRVPIADSLGSAAAVAGIATNVGVNIRSLQTIDAGGVSGVLEMLIAIDDIDALRDALANEGFRLSVVNRPESEHER